MDKNIFFFALSVLLVEQQIFAVPERSDRGGQRDRRQNAQQDRSRSRSEERKEDHAERRALRIQTDQQLQQHLSQPVSDARSLKISDQAAIFQLRQLAFQNPNFFKNLKHFDLSGQCLVYHSRSDVFGGLDWRLLFSMKFDRLKSLNLSETDIGDYQYIIRDLAKAHFPSLTRLNLSGTELTGMFEPFSNNALKDTLEVINLSGTQMQDEDLLNFLKGSWRNLHNLNLSGNDFSYNQITEILGALRNYELLSLKKIDLSYAVHYPSEISADQGKEQLRALVRAQDPNIVFNI